MKSLWSGAIAALIVMITGTSSADDTDIYLYSSESTGLLRPQILIIFDTSGSMRTEEAVAKQPFDPNRDYTGTNSKRIYYKKSSEADYPDPDGTESYRYTEWDTNACASSLEPHPDDPTKSILEYAGRYTDNMRYFFKDNEGWHEFRSTFPSDIDRNKIVIECLNDLREANAENAANHPDTSLRGEGFPVTDSTNSPFDGIAASADLATRQTAADASITEAQFGSDDAVTLFTENYLVWHHTAEETNRQRIAIARDTINGIINTTPGIDFGLAVFNENDASDRTDDGGRIVFGIDKMTDTNRSALTTMVSSLTADGWTPLCETLYEASRYFGGKSVVTGTLKPSENPSYDLSVINESNDYISPLATCQPQSYVVLITDGIPTRDEHLNGDIKLAMPGLTDSDGLDGNLLPGIAGWMADPENDVNENVAGKQQVFTYTIGFSAGADDARAILSLTAQRGNGKYFAAQDATALQDSLEKVLIEILETDASFTSPSVAANNSDRSRTMDSLYYSMFLPSDRPRWLGNLKKLKINSDGRLVSQNEYGVDGTGKFDDRACTFWTSSTTCSSRSDGGDGNEVEVGGALEAITNQTNRDILTNPSSGSGALVGLNRTTLTAAVGEDDLQMALDTSDSAEIDKYVAWILGQDPDDEDNDGSAIDRRADILGDALHFKPLALNYGDTLGIRILVGTNHGFLHMFHDKPDDTVEESWAYYLPDLIDNVPALRANRQTGGHTVYGIDGGAAAYINDTDGDGVLDSGEDVWVFFGLRRGGRSYYALDLTAPDSPELMWEVNSDTTNMAELGQTWSEPVVTKIPGNSGKPVVIVGGGYDTNKDSTGLSTADSLGRAIYVLDAASGALVHRFVAGESAASDVTPISAEDSFASKIVTLDSDGDGITDRLYANDTGGNVWRVDMPSDSTSSWSVFKFAELSGDTVATDRRFYAEPSIAQTSTRIFETFTVTSDDGGSSEVIRTSETPYDAVLMGSGYRAEPNSTGTQDYLFMLQDRYVHSQTFGTESNPYPDTIEITDLYSVDGDPFSSATTDEELLTQRLALGEKQGWYYSLSEAEKSLSAPIVLDGVAYFTTFTPGGVNDEECLSLGKSRLYGFGLQQGLSLLDASNEGGILDTLQLIVPPESDDGDSSLGRVPLMVIDPIGNIDDGSSDDGGDSDNSLPTGTIPIADISSAERQYFFTGD